MKNIIIYTDGSCNVKTRLGGFGSYIQYLENNTLVKEVKLNGGYSDTTVSRMELRAIIKALEKVSLPWPGYIVLISDSEYTINSINKGWVKRWESENFSGRKNSDLWRQFLSVWSKFSSTNLIFIHTRGHGKGKACYQKGNEIADQLADYRQFKIYTKDEETNI